MYSLKSLVAAISLILISWSCQEPEAKPVLEDSTDVYPATPITLTKAEFRQYYRIAQSFFDSCLLKRGFNGAILVAKKGRIIYEKYQGAVHLHQNDTITASTPFHIASTTKTFTGMGVLKLWQEGKLSLNDSIQKFFPGFPYPGLTVKMLLSHRSGLPNYSYALEDGDWDKKVEVCNEDLIKFFEEKEPALNHPVGKRFSYSNTNFALLALIIEKVSGMAYPDFMRLNFFEPLGMKNTFVLTKKDSSRMTPSYKPNGYKEPFTYLDWVYGDKDIFSTVEDIYKWDQALYNNNMFTQQTLDSAFCGYSFEKPGKLNYGLGWRMVLLPNQPKVIYHNGWWHGNNSCFYRVPSDSLTIIVLGNKYNNNIYHVKPLIEALSSIRFNGEVEDE